MPPPNNRAKRRQKKAAGTIPQSRPLEEPPHLTLVWSRKYLTRIVEVVAAILSIVFFVHEIVQKPQIHVQTSQTSAPFSLYFSFHNSSWVLGMGDVQIQCDLKDVITDRNNRIAGITLSAQPIKQNVSIPPSETIQYICPFDKFFLNFGTIQTAQILIQAKFSTLGIERDTHSEILNWNHISRQWTEGEIVN